MDLVYCVCQWVPARLGRSKGFVCLHATSSRIFYYQSQPVVQKARKVISFSHVKGKQDQECGGKVCRNPKDQHLVFLTSKQSKAKTSCDSKMADKTVVQEGENQCEAKIKETSSAQCPVSLKGRRPHALRGPMVPLQKNSEGPSSHLRRVRSCVASSCVWSRQQNRRFPNSLRGTPSVPACTQYGCSRPWSTVTARDEERCTRPASVLHGGHDASEGTMSMQASVQASRSQRESPSNAGEARLRDRQPR